MQRTGNNNQLLLNVFNLTKFKKCKLEYEHKIKGMEIAFSSTKWTVVNIFHDCVNLKRSEGNRKVLEIQE